MNVDDTVEISNFDFDGTCVGLQIEFENMKPTAAECFEKLWDDEVMNLITTSMNSYRESLECTNRPHRKSSRYFKIKTISQQDIKQSLALCILQGQAKYPSFWKMFFMNPRYYSPAFHLTLSGRRFEEH